MAHVTKGVYNRRWTAEDEGRLIELMDEHVPYERVAKRLKRGVGAIKQRCFQLGICLTTANGYSLNRVANLMGVDSHTVAWWARKGLLESHPTCQSGHGGIMRIVEHDELVTFIENESHWHLWEPARIRDLALREWATELRGHVRFLTTAQVGDRLGYTHYAICSLIEKGKIRAVKCSNNWLVREDWVRPPVHPKPKKSRPITAQEVEIVRRHWGQVPSTEIGAIGTGNEAARDRSEHDGVANGGRTVAGGGADDKRPARSGVRSDDRLPAQPPDEELEDRPESRSVQRSC